MKLTKQNNNKFNLELDKFELDCLHTVTNNIAVSSDLGDVTYDFYIKSKDLGAENLCPPQDAGWGVIRGLKFEAYREKKVEKKNCSFFYPKENFRQFKNSNIDNFEHRKLTEAYIEGDYLCGVDNMWKRFKLDLVKHLVWDSK